jgi:threonyl-tRNA synthetase
MMLYRQRRFNMPDLHPYFLDLGQAFEYFPKIQAKIIEACDAVNREYQMSIEVGSEKFWVENRAEILEIAKNFGKPVLCIVNNDEKDRYWIVNVDFKIVDALGKSREIACIQVDIGNAKRLGIEYLNKEGVKVNPVIIHSAVPGGIERYIYMALDNYPESFPIWLAPIQMRLLPVNKSHVEFCVNLAAQLKLKGIRVDIDDRDQSIGRKIVSAKDELIANSFVIGDKEIAGDGNMELISRNINEILENMKDKPVKHFLWPNQLSKRLG